MAEGIEFYDLNLFSSSLFWYSTKNTHKFHDFLVNDDRKKVGLLNGLELRLKN